MTVTPATRISTSARVLGVGGKVTATNAGLVSVTSAHASRFFQYDSRCEETPFLRAHPAVLSAVGDVVEVVYDPANPSRADVRTEVTGWRLWFGLWCAVAALPAAIACLPFVMLVRQRRTASRGIAG